MAQILPPMLRQSVNGLIGTKPLPDGRISKIAEQFRAAEADWSTLGVDTCSGQNLHTFLGHLDRNAIPFARFNQLVLLAVNQNGAVHTLKLLLYILVPTY